MYSIKYYLILILSFTSLYSAGGSDHINEKVDGEYIMHHIQDAVVFEIFNPLDYNDSNYGILTKDECYDIKKKYKKKYPNKKVV